MKFSSPPTQQNLNPPLIGCYIYSLSFNATANYYYSILKTTKPLNIEMHLVQICIKNEPTYLVSRTKYVGKTCNLCLIIAELNDHYQFLYAFPR